jgi:hypothetical protein
MRFFADDEPRRRPRPDRYERAALRFVNYVRRELGCAPLRALQPGAPNDLLLSPLSTSTSSHFSELWGDEMLFALDEHFGRRYPLSRNVRTFTARFDNLRYPHLLDTGLLTDQAVGDVPHWIPESSSSSLMLLEFLPEPTGYRFIADEAADFLAQAGSG